MKNVLNSLIVFLIIAVLTLSACNYGEGTYYPSNSEMKANLENEGYNVAVFNDLSASGFGDQSLKSDHKGTLLTATKYSEVNNVTKVDYIYFYRLDDAKYCEYYFNAMEQYLEDYNSLVKIENDEKFGNIVYCGTSDAIDAAGILVVDVNVKI